ncbi:MAG: hypothetical protein WD757_04995 [Actinomycetota bacterium]
MPGELSAAKGPEVAALAAGRLGVAESATLPDSLEADVTPGQRVLTISFSDSDPDGAARYARAYAEAYIEHRVQQDRAVWATQEAALRVEAAKAQSRVSRYNQALGHMNPGRTGRITQVQSRVEEAFEEWVLIQQVLMRFHGDPGGLAEGAAGIETVSHPAARLRPIAVARAVGVALIVGLGVGAIVARRRGRADQR